MKKLLQEFKTFAMRGNMIDMAVGIIIGAGFGKIVTSIVSDIIMPPIGLLIGGVDFIDLKIVIKQGFIDATGVMQPAVTINYGNFIQTLFDFIIVAFCIFLVIKLISKLQNTKDTKPTTPTEPSKEEQLLTEIRDLLKEKKN